MKFKDCYQLLEKYLFEGYKEAITDFSTDAEIQDVRKTVEIYKDLVKRNQVKGQERNIDYWRKQGWNKFDAFVKDLKDQPSKTKIKRKMVTGKAINLWEDDRWLIVIPLDKQASCFHGRKTDWCTTKPNQSNFELYFYDREITLIYCLEKETGKLWAIAAHKDIDKTEMFTQNNSSITKNQFKSQTGLDAQKIIDLAFKNEKVDKSVKETRSKWKEAVASINQMISDKSEDYKTFERLLRYTKDGKSAVAYVKYRANA